ncbi:hypothetical protein D3C71_1037580 [compost metagenome]
MQEPSALLFTARGGRFPLQEKRHRHARTTASTLETRGFPLWSLTMRVLLFCAVAAMALSACGQGERTDQAQHADAVRQTAPTGSEPARNVPGGGSGTAASEEQDSGAGANDGKDALPESPAKR